MATQVGLVIGRQVVIRQVIVPDFDVQLDDISALSFDDRMVRLPADLYATMTGDTLTQLGAWLSTLSPVQFAAVTDQDVADKVTEILTP